MNKKIKGYSILLFIVWPLSAVVTGLKNFNYTFGRNLIIALYAFLGFTAVSKGDLERYEDDYYTNQGTKIVDLFMELISLQVGKFYNSFISIICGVLFESHHFYFLILFLIYGYFYISTINLFTNDNYFKLDKRGLIFFYGVLMFLLIRPLPNIAFYTGGIFVVYNMVSYYRYREKRYLYFIFFCPLIHIGLTIYLIVPILLLLFKNKTWFYIIFLMLTFAAGKSQVVGVLGSLAESNSESIIKSKYDGYASDEGQARLEEHYAENNVKKNIKNKILIIVQDIVLSFLIPIGIAILYFMKRKLLSDYKIKLLFHIVLLFWSVANLMMNISQGERFVVLFSFISIGLFFTVHTNMSRLSNYNLLSIFFKIFIPTLFVLGLMTTYASNILFPREFFLSNFFVQFSFLIFPIG